MQQPSKQAALGVLLGASIFSGGAIAQNVDLLGRFVNPVQSEEPIKAAIEIAAKEFNFITRPFARSQLKRDNPVIKLVAIEPADKAVSITLGASQPSTTEPGRAAVKWTRPDGEVFDVSTEWQGASLVQTFIASYGKRVNRYTLAADGMTLALHVTLTSPQLKAPVQYQLSFTRESPR